MKIVHDKVLKGQYRRSGVRLKGVSGIENICHNIRIQIFYSWKVLLKRVAKGNGRAFEINKTKEVNRISFFNSKEEFQREIWKRVLRLKASGRTILSEIEDIEIRERRRPPRRVHCCCCFFQARNKRFLQ